MGIDDRVGSRSDAASRLDRRSFLQRTATGLGATAVFSIPGLKPGPVTKKKKLTAYRLSTHGRRVCAACKNQAANRFYISSAAANTDRAHLGCNCGIVTQELKFRTWACYFRHGKSGVYDRRGNRQCPAPR